ncbi:MAG: type III secretion system chaperone [Duodenibacillus sp.]|nr:type III secretion system chaperone [Duodenibacillus sp.]
MSFNTHAACPRQQCSTFFFREGGGALYLQGRVGDAGRLDRDGCMELLRASLLGADTGGCALAVSPGSQAVVLTKRHDCAGGEVAGLQLSIGGFLAEMAEWKRRLAAGSPGQAPAGEEPAPAFGMYV